MTDNPSDADPKIIVDEDWKSKVDEEKRAAQAARSAGQTPQSDATERPATASSTTGTSGPPPASFSLLVTTLATQAMAGLGVLADPEHGHPVVRPDVAKHYIDTLGVLEEKTRGNLSDEEARMLTDVLHELRMMFVSVRKPDAVTQPGAATDSSP